MGRKRQLLNRVRIMDGAKDLLASGQYRDLTVDGLSRHLSMSKSTLYKYYRDKDDLVNTLVDEACTETDRELADLGSRLDKTAPVDALRGILQIYGAHGRRLPAAIVLETESLPTAARNRLANTRGDLDEMISDVVGRGAASGSLRLGDGALVTTAVSAAAAATVEAGARGDLATDVAELLPLFVS